MDAFVVYQIVALLVAVILHEVAHGWVADRLGDPTARLAGRLSLNPIVHLDPYGSLLIPFILIIVNSPFIIGWAKPVPFDPYNLKNPRKDSALIALAGPATNLILAVISAVVIRVLFASAVPAAALFQFLAAFIWINVLLALFNLIPIHPLDGGKIFISLLPEKEAEDANFFLRRYGLLILLLLLFPFGERSAFSYVAIPVMNFIMGILLPNIGVI